MHSMGIAFSASMYGLLGSIILGFMMVSVRRCMGDISSLLGSEVAQHIEFALARDGFAYSKTGLKLGLGRRSEPLALRDVVEPSTAESTVGQALEGGGESAPSFIAGLGEAQPRPAVAEASGGMLTKTSGEALVETSVEEIRLLRRIEERLAETMRLQERALATEIDDFHKQRSEMLRALAENSEAANNFRSELQRVGRQLGTMLTLMEKSNVDVVDQVTDLKLRMADDAAEMQRLLAALLKVAQQTPE